MPGYRYIQTIARAAHILELVGNSPEGLSLTQIASTYGLSRQTTYNILRTLAHTGLLKKLKSPTRYAIGPAFNSLRAANLSASQAFVRRSLPTMLRLSRETDALVILSQYVGGEAMGRIRATPEPDEKPVLQYNWRMGPYCNGLFFQAYMDPEELADYRERSPLCEEEASSDYWNSFDAVDDVIRRIRQEGYLAYIKGEILRVLAPVLTNGALAAVVAVYKQSVLACSDCGARQCIDAAVAAAGELSDIASRDASAAVFAVGQGQ